MRNLLVILTLAAGAGTAAPVLAQDKAASSPLMAELTRCKAEQDADARLRCYDSAVGALTDASARGDVLVVNREDVRKTRRSLFGFNLPKLPFFGGDDSEEAEEVEVSIRSARMIESGKYVFAFDDGSTWQTTEAKPIRPSPGDKVTIKKASLGSYFLRINGRAVRGMRIK